MKILVVGGTGLVGQELLRQLAARTDFSVTALVRKRGALPHLAGSVGELLFDFDREEDYARLTEYKFDAVFCCLGTTISKAGSQEKFHLVDLVYPQRLAAALGPQAVKMCVISAVGANGAGTAGFYLQTKFEMEKAVASSGVQAIFIRPSLLTGDRSEFRLGERVAIILAQPLAPLMVRYLGRQVAKYAPISAVQVARAMIYYTLAQVSDGKRVIEGRDLFDIPVS